MKKIKIRKISVPLKKMNDKEKDYVAAVLEDMNHNFKAFGEVLSAVKEKGDATFEEVGKINERLASVEIQLDDIKKEITSIKNEIKELRLSLSRRADIKKLENLELRIVKIEEYLKLSL